MAAEPKDPPGAAEIFVVRGGENGNRYSWEIRRYGAIVVARGAEGYHDGERARQAGRTALHAMAAPHSDR